MAYRILYTARAQRDLAQLDPAVKERIARMMEKCARQPYEHVRKMASPSLGTYRIRVGDWRVICDIHGDTVLVLRAGHRREIYRG